ncbi:MAG: hypothetical protein FJW20_17910 [Acidimicrobiia bacterium]|nr:hypothetical protein [Acidimicrobiia bacterium]
MTITQPDRFSRSVILTAAAVIAAWSGHVALRQFYEPGHALRLAATAALIATFGGMIAALVRLIRGLDEFQRQVQLMALAIAFPASMVACFALGFLRAEGMFVNADPRDLPAVMLLCYAVGLGLAHRRYQ